MNWDEDRKAQPGADPPAPAASSTHAIVIPTYNTGRRVIDTVRGALSRWTPVWVVVDGSNDGTAEALDDLAAVTPGLRVIRHARNRGKGAAVLTGAIAARRAGATHVLTMDADGQHCPDDIRTLMEASIANPSCLVLGEPVFDDTAPLLRVRGRRISNWWTNLETLWGGIHDSLFGFRVYPAEALIRAMHSTRFARRFDFEPEAAVRLLWRGIRPINIPTPVRYFSTEEGGVSHFRYLRDNPVLAWMHVRLLLGFLARLPLLVSRRLRESHPAPGEPQGLHRRIAACYSGRARRHYVRAKLGTDPLYAAVFEALRGSSHDLLDIGCGIGLLALYLRGRGFAPAITGIDYDGRKIDAAREAAARARAENTRFLEGDARDALPEFRGNIAILDVLQFMPPDAQEQLLRRAAASIVPGASLIIRSGLSGDTWRFRITRCGDRLARWIGWMKDKPAAYPTAAFLRATLEAEGLAGEISPLWGKTPFGNFLIVFRL